MPNIRDSAVSSRMPSVVGLLEQHELATRRRVDGLREKADRIQAELAAAEEEWREWAIARWRADVVLAPDCGNTADTETAPDPRDADARSAPGMRRSRSLRCRCGGKG
ncbi:hypothetical protein J2Z21_008865 [Streptomyces griseochromogenes]|uniref:Uncharacterized protein n=1 Tax=Streptomyces griseochromogenes TaxID=68214 RepID=A0ABS4M8Y7_9ACTN|nr:hypothetical protein [Streptomyces griseochromogenes]MBP2055849.1 hypothetical protein [Streptomyces griseochromogenes]